jgi:hypothetical protein
MPISAKIVNAHRIETMTGIDGKLYVFRIRELKQYLKIALGVAPVKVFREFQHAFDGRHGIVVFDVIG